MTKQEIAEMIAKYAITDNRDGRIKISNTKIVTDAIYKQIISVKPEILAYFADERAEYQRRRQTFEEIPGVKKLRAARAEREAWRTKMRRAMERGTCRYPTAPKSDEVAIAEKYPAAKFALMVEEQRYGSNAELASIAAKAYDALSNGEPWEQVKAAYDADNKAFVERHLWD